MKSNQLKRFTIILCLLLLLQECNAKFSFAADIRPDIRRSHVNVKKSGSGDKGFVDDWFRKDGHKDETLHQVEDKYDIVIENIQNRIQNERKKRYAVQAIILSVSTVLQVTALALPNCREIYLRYSTFKKLKTQVDEEKRQVNLDWGNVDAEERHLDRLNSDVKVMEELFSTMDEIRADIIQSLEPEVLQELNNSKTDIKEQVRLVNQLKLKGTGDFAVTEFSLIFFSGVGITMGYVFKAGPTIPGTNVYSKSMSKIKLFKFAVVKFGGYALAGLSIALVALQFVVSNIKCKEAVRKTDEAIISAKNALKNITILQKQIQTFHNNVVGNYSILWDEITGYDFSKFVKTAIDITKSSEKKTSKLVKSIKNLETFYNGINKTKNNLTGQFNYEKVGILTKNVIDGLLQTNVQLNCVLKKTRIVREIEKKCQKGEGSFDTIWESTMKNSGRNIQKCVVKYISFSQTFIKLTIKKMMPLLGKSEICIRNNKIINEMVCQRYFANDDLMVIANEIKNIDIDDVKYFAEKCPQPEITEQLANLICRMKESKKPKEVVYNKFPRYRQANLESTWENCKLSDEQMNFICLKKQNMVKLQVVIDSLKSYKSDAITKVYKECQIEISPAAGFPICFAFKTNNQALLNQFLSIYGQEKISAYVKTPGNCQ